MNKIFIIQGNTGEYSDRCDWMVKAYFSQERAQKHMEILNNKLKELKLLEGFEGDWKQRDDNSKIMKQFDEQFMCDYTGSYYMLITVDLEDYDINT